MSTGRSAAVRIKRAMISTLSRSPEVLRFILKAAESEPAKRFWGGADTAFSILNRQSQSDHYAFL
jgi:hypothetical protein